MLKVISTCTVGLVSNLTYKLNSRHELVFELLGCLFWIPMIQPILASDSIIFFLYCIWYLKRSSIVVAECKNARLPYYPADTTKQLASGNMYILILDTHIY